jgi:hypothetical protein
MAAIVSVKAPINGEVLRWARESIGVRKKRDRRQTQTIKEEKRKNEEGKVNLTCCHY